MMNQYIDTAIEFLGYYGVKLLIAIVIYVVGKWVAKTIANTGQKLMTRAKVDAALIGFAHSLIYWALLFFAIIAALGQLGVQTASFVAIVGAAGLAIGLALQGSLANFAAGVLILIFRPFRLDDYIEAAGTAGTVEQITVFNTILTTPDNKRVIAPNAAVTAGNITNFSVNENRRVDLVVGISYRDDIDKARDAIKDVLAQHTLILPSPAATVAVVELGDSSVNFVVRPWCKSADYWTIHFDITEALKKRFDQEGISIPFPQTEVHLVKNDQG